MGVADTKRPPNYASIYFKLSYVCPRTWWFRKADFETVTLQTLLKRHKIEEIEADRNTLLILVGQKQAPGQKGRHRHSSRVQRHKFLTNHTSIDCNCICGWLVSQGFWDTRISVCFSTHYIFFFWGGGGCSKGGLASHPIYPPWIFLCIASHFDFCNSLLHESPASELSIRLIVF